MAEMKLDDAPRKARELYEKGMRAFESNNLDYAIGLFMTVLELEPRLLQVRKFLRAAELKKFKSAKKSKLARQISTVSGMGGVMAVKGSIKKKPLEALQQAEKLLQKDPLNLTFVNLLGEAAVAADMPEVALQTLEIAKEHYPGNVPLLEWLGTLYRENDIPAKARDCYEELCRIKPNDQGYIKNLKDMTALATMKKGGWDEAGSYRDVIKDSREAAVLEQQSKAVKSSKDVDSLIIETKAKVQQEPQNINFRRALADLLAKAERFDDALEALEEAQKITGGADPQVDLSMSMIKLRKFDKQIEAFRAAGDEEGAVACETEKKTFQRQDAQQRVERYPNDMQFRFELGQLLFEEGDLNGAIQQFQLSQRNPQKRTRSLYFLAMCFKQKQQFDIAMEQLEKACGELHVMDNTKKDILYEMGSIAEAMGDTQKAVGFYKEIYAVDIGYRDIAEKIDNAYQQ
jgi:tetratricopeptide (TPR) repeat protein